MIGRLVARLFGLAVGPLAGELERSLDELERLLDELDLETAWSR